MGYALKIYEAFEELGKERASILAEFVEYMESKRAATSEEVRESELRLQKEIEQVRKEVKEVELRLRGEIEQVRLEVERVKSSLVKWMFIFWIGQVIAIIGILRWLLH